MLKADTRAKASAPVFAALGDPTRLALYSALSDGAPKSITALTLQSSVTRQAVTKHLAVLETAGLISSEKNGREKNFTLRHDGLDDAKDLLDKISAEWDGALQRLKDFVED
ncbi:MAG: transcriptional regulator [Hyphococcus sp.]|nr:MAG: transcriptional regulator [Marinicaulis sp.]